MRGKADPKGKDYPYLRAFDWKTKDRWVIERAMIRHGGFIDGIGEGLEFHYKAAISALWPSFDWHIYAETLIREFATEPEIAVMGPASTGKTFTAAAYGLCTFWVWPKGTSVVMSSTTKDGLQFRIWGSIKQLFNDAREIRRKLPGRLIESKFMLTSATTGDENDLAQDFRDGIVGVACKVGGTFVGLSNYVGLKNDRVMLIADEASLMGRGFLDSIANLRKNPSFKFICMGNPKEQTDALGIAAEPASEDGGWASYDPTPATRRWRTRGGVAVQLSGYDSPNYRFPRGLNPYGYLITPEQIEKDLRYYGEGSVQFTMMNLGVMPRESSTRRLITRLLCEQRGAFDQPIWGADGTTDVAGLDPAYKGIGGDRCVLRHLRFGKDRDGKQLLASVGLTLVPIDASSKTTSEDQIAFFVKNWAEDRGIKPQNFAFDSTVAGTLALALAKHWSPAVLAVPFGGPPDERMIRDGDPRTENEAYGKKVSALWFASYYLIEAGQLRGIDSESVEEASMREWIHNASKTSRRRAPVVDVEPKEDMKKRTGRSPDLWDGFVVGLEAARRHGFVIGSAVRSLSNGSRTPDWVMKRRKSLSVLAERHALVYS